MVIDSSALVAVLFCEPRGTNSCGSSRPTLDA
jgi:uncharacterized protein with PIN domain